jgi:hypothetical protein
MGRSALSGPPGPDGGLALEDSAGHGHADGDEDQAAEQCDPRGPPPYRVGGRPPVVTRRARAYPAAASRSSPNASASRGAGHEALRPLGLGSAHTRVSPMVPSCGPTAAPGRPNATR